MGDTLTGTNGPENHLKCPPPRRRPENDRDKPAPWRPPHMPGLGWDGCGVFSVTKFKGKIETSDGESFDIPAESCPHCRGIGYLTKPLVYESRRRGSDEFEVRRVGSGDKCPLCVGRGWIGLMGTWEDKAV